MKVELYEIEEVRNETEQQDAEAIALCEQLGLTGQIKKDTETDTTVRIPYRLMTDEEKFVYSTLCPEKVSVEQYSNGPIPLQVLKTLAYAKSLNVFQTFYIWSASSVKVKDPVLVAYPGTYYQGKEHILARWADELLPLEVLIPDAIKVAWAKRVDRLNEIKVEVEQLLSRPMPQSSTNISIPTFYP